MKQYFFLQKLIAFSLCIPSISFAEDNVIPSALTREILKEPGAITLKPPSGWKGAKQDDLPPRVKMMIVGKGRGYYPPSINIGVEPYRGTLKDYLLMVKRVNESLGSQWKDLGKVQTKSGKASLSQVDMNTEWGPVRLMHVILVKNRTVYVVTAGALKEEYSLHYKDFFNAFSSISLNPDVFDLVHDQKKQSRLLIAYNQLIKIYDSNPKEFEFESAAFQKKHWEPFVAFLQQDFQSMGSDWIHHTKQKIYRDLTAEYD